MITEKIKIGHYKRICIIMNKHNIEKNTYCINEIVKATLELLNNKLIKDLSISSIILKAGVARSTFYRNFNSVKDVLSYYIKTLLKKELGPNYIFVGTYRDFIYNLMEFCVKYKDVCITLNKNNMTIILVEKLIEEIEACKHITNEIEKYGLSGITFGLYGWLHAWFKDDLKKSPLEILEIYDKYQEQKHL